MAETTETTEKLPLTEDNVRKTIKQVDDPEIGINIVDLGLVYEVNLVNDKEVQVVMTLTTPFCPVGPSIKQQIGNVIKKDVEGVEKVDVQFTFNPPWDKDMMSDEAKDELGLF
ncbi:MAG TPA: metal-sulfur cluster assembly factor [Chloroflexota bacterium]|nr:metal-sulfur cluster assembly factor [Chloroflexota bacterium]